MATNDGNAPIITYKGFDKNLVCAPSGAVPFQYRIGETYEITGPVKACKSGFHACEYPLDIFNFYPPAGSRFAQVEQSGDLDRDRENSKVASRKIKIAVELNIAGLVKAAIEYTTERCLPIDPASPASASGDQGAAQASGTRGAAQASGSRGAAQASGYQGAAQASGDQGAAQASGDQGAAQASGSQGAAQASGTQGAAQASGYQGAAQASGTRGAAQASGRHSTAAATGFEGKAKGVAGTALFLVFRDSKPCDDEYGRILHARAVIVGRDGIKEDTFYTLNSAGAVVEFDK